MIKLPAILEDKQKQIDHGINAFAAELLAESFGDDPERFKDVNLMLVNHTHKGQPVFIILTKTQPKLEDFQR